ncbi:unnamed protein product [Protopolystoma xenopodis]|uniref:Uncharacterized protein n=1 Tax=Protopolystoma xenopodis TaxID=117903 RepID=A0A3S4ZXX8_9PLAT|nr:unnamed protein product [Protopolystoma xenopodis]
MNSTAKLNNSLPADREIIISGPNNQSTPASNNYHSNVSYGSADVPRGTQISPTTSHGNSFLDSSAYAKHVSPSLSSPANAPPSYSVQLPTTNESNDSIKTPDLRSNMINENGSSTTDASTKENGVHAPAAKLPIDTDEGLTAVCLYDYVACACTFL